MSRRNWHGSSAGWVTDPDSPADRIRVAMAGGAAPPIDLRQMIDRWEREMPRQRSRIARLRSGSACAGPFYRAGCLAGGGVVV